jgi:hypothetical protein
MTTISRKPPSAAALNFVELRRTGIAHLERIVGSLWSDYNVHDPGITLLELLCYGITDITHRTTFPDAELFATAPGEQADEPQEPPFATARFALTNAPVTINDYRKLFLDRFPELRNAWLDPVSETLFANTKTRELARKSGPDNVPFEIRGLYRVRLLFHDGVKKARQNEIIAGLKRFYYAHRNLCEDLATVQATPLQDILVCAEIQLKPEAEIESTHAVVFHALRNFLAPAVPRYSLSALVEKGLPAEDIFDGPRLENGFILESDLDKADTPTAVFSSDLIAVILAVPGVQGIGRFQLNTPAKGETSNPPSEWELPLAPGTYPRLTLENARLDFYKGPLPFRSDLEKVRNHLATLDAEEERAAQVSGPFDRSVPLGTWRDLADFTTLQDSLPLNYGVGRRGFDASAETGRLSKARQLQAFLLVFDQLLANYLAQLGNLRALFSADPLLRQSYFTRAVADLPDMSEIFALKDPEAYAKLMEASRAEHDLDWAERRSLFLNHLLARFGEVFTDHVLMHYSTEGLNTAEELVECKRRFFAEVPGLAYHRYQAHDILDAEQVWDTSNVSGFEKRIGRLLGFASSDRRNLSDVVCELYEEKDTDTASEIRFRIVDTQNKKTILSGTRHYRNKDAALAEMRVAIRLGMSAANYRFATATDGTIYFTIVDATGEIVAMRKEFWQTQVEAETARDRIVALLSRQYSEEGMFLIEHLLLRPRPKAPQSWPLLPAPCACSSAEGAATCTAAPEGWDPYGFRVHLVFPGYTPRLADSGFRRAVEEIVRRELPAHLAVKICFVGREQLGDFEKKYRAWLDSLATGDPTATAAEALVDCLNSLHSIHPAGTLHECKEDGDEASAIVLNQSRLGTLPAEGGTNP